MLICEEFQTSIDERLVGSYNVSELLEKQAKASFLLMKTITECVTSCGCVKNSDEIMLRIDKIDYNALLNALTQMTCVNCRKRIEEALGECLVALTSICSVCGISITDIFIQEQRNLDQMKVL